MKGSLRDPRSAGCLDGPIGTNGKAPEAENKPAYFQPQGLPIKPLSNPDLANFVLFVVSSSIGEIRVFGKAKPVPQNTRSANEYLSANVCVRLRLIITSISY